MWVNFQRIIELFTKKIVTKLSKVWVWDPGSGKKPIPDTGSDPEVKKAPDHGSGTLLDKMRIKYYEQRVKSDKYGVGTRQDPPYFPDIGFKKTTKQGCKTETFSNFHE